MRGRVDTMPTVETLQRFRRDFEAAIKKMNNIGLQAPGTIYMPIGESLLTSKYPYIWTLPCQETNFLAPPSKLKIPVAAAYPHAWLF
jgi:hypothetical protein